MVTLRFSKLILMLCLGLLGQACAGDMPDDRSLAFPSNSTPANTYTNQAYSCNNVNQTSSSSWYGGIGSGIGNALSSGLGAAGYYLGKLVPSSVANFFNDLGKSAMAKGISTYNYIASLAPESPVLEGGALQAAKDNLSTLKDQATDLLEQAIQLNQRLTAYAGVSERYQRPAAIGLLVGETVATIAALYYSIGLIKAALAAGAKETLSETGAESTQVIAEKSVTAAADALSDVTTSTLSSSGVSQASSAVSPIAQAVAQPPLGTLAQGGSALGNIASTLAQVPQEPVLHVTETIAGALG
ncbi:MAG TPA: hypothetical protein VHA52_06500, partial [Candidatus Babeliaceae bacterium]|nr:hypothetical protein [Candidatus Babeliaceae bacterium]